MDSGTLTPSGTIGIFPVTFCNPYVPTENQTRNRTQPETTNTPSESSTKTTQSQSSPWQTRFASHSTREIERSASTSNVLGSALSSRANHRPPPVATGSMIVPFGSQAQRTSSPPTTKRGGKFATLRAPPLTAVEAQAQAQAQAQAKTQTRHVAVRPLPHRSSTQLLTFATAGW